MIGHSLTRRADQKCAALLIFVSVVLLLFLTKPAFGASSITITYPAGGEIFSENGDFAIDRFGDPWDMSQPTDFANGYYYWNISGLNIINGELCGTTTSSDPSIFLHHPGQAGAVATGRDGVNNPINASYYNALSISMYSDQATSGQLYWFYNSYWTDYGVINFSVQSGWHTYKINLASSGSWTGQPLGLRIDPATTSGVSFKIDWVKLHRASQQSFTAQWNDVNPGYVSLYLDEDANQTNGNEVWVGGKNDQASNNSMSVDTSAYAAGTYYVYMVDRTGQRTSSVPFSLNQPPLIQILDPDLTGGEDFATVASGDPWDMSQLSDVADWPNVSSVGCYGTYVFGINTNGDPSFYLRVPGAIDTSRFYRATFRIGYTGPFDIGAGSVARLIWNPNGTYGPTFQVSEDIVVYPPITEYTVDMRTLPLEYGGIGWSGWMNSFRIDPIEFPDSRGMYLDHIKLAGDDTASNGTFSVRWRDDKSSPRPTRISIYADPDTTYNNGNDRLVAQNIDQVAGENSYLATFNGIASGTYYLYMVANDGISTAVRYATGPLVISVPAYRASWNVVTAPPSTMFSGETYPNSVTLNVTNQGSATWRASGAGRVLLAHLWTRADGSFVSFGETVATLPHDVALGESAQLTASVTAPASLGSYVLRFDLVNEGSTWFNNHGSPTQDFPVEVKALVALTDPAQGSFVSGVKTIQTLAGSSVQRVEFKVDGALRSTDNVAPFSHAWDTTLESTGIHTIEAKAYTATGTASETKQVIVFQGVPTETWFTWYDMASYGMNGNWILVGNPSSSGALYATISIGGESRGIHAVAPDGRVTPTYAGTINGPVLVRSTGSVLASQRVIYHGSFNEVYGLPSADLSTEVLFTWYDLASPGMNGNWILVANPSSTQTASVQVYIAGSLKGTYAVPAGGRATPTYPGTIGGPVKIVSDIPIFASQRVLYQSSFSEVYGLPVSRVGADFCFTWYDWASPGMNGNWILVANPSTTDTANVEIMIAGQLKGTYSVPPGSRITPAYPGTIGGPVQVKSTNGVSIYCSQRVLYHGSFEELYGLRATSVANNFYFTWYDLASPGMNGNWILIANPSSTQTANVQIYIAGSLKGTYAVPAGGRATPTYPGTIGGPVKMVSDIPIYCSQRVLYQSSFNEVFGLPF